MVPRHNGVIEYLRHWNETFMFHVRCWPKESFKKSRTEIFAPKLSSDKKMRTNLLLENDVIVTRR